MLFLYLVLCPSLHLCMTAYCGHHIHTAWQLPYFAASRVLLRGHELEVAYDVDGSRYGGLVGMSVWVDGALVAHTTRLERLVLPGVLRQAE